MTPASAVEEYLAAVSPEQRAALQQLRETIRSAAPAATEVFAYKMPGFKHHGGLVYYAAWAKHCALYGIGSALTEQYREDLAPFVSNDSTLRFTPEKPIPAPLVEKLVRARVQENEAAVKAKR